MKFDIILAGVGGQGILTIAHLIDFVAIHRGIHFKQAEVHGMSQRGGAVYSHLRLSDSPVYSDLIPEGKADLILSLEPLEVGRYLGWLNPETGRVVTNSAPVKNIPDYPADEDVFGALLELPRISVIDANALAAHARLPKASNVALLGAAMPLLPLDIDDVRLGVQTLLARKGASVVEANLKVLNLGFAAGTLHKNLREAGVGMQVCSKLMPRLDPDSLAAADAAELAAVLAKSPLDILARLETTVAPVPATRAGLCTLLA